MALPATDAFTGSDGTALTTYSANWTLNFGNFALFSNSLRPNGGDVNTDAAAHWNADTFGNDQYAQGTVPAISTAYMGVAARCATSAATFYNFLVNSDAYYLNKYVAGAGTNLGNTPSPDLTVGDTLRIEANGTSIVAKRNGTNKIGPITDSSITSGSAGVTGNGTGTGGVRIDNWEGGNLGAASYVETGFAVAGLVSAGADITQVSEVGAAICGWVASGAESTAANYVETGSAVARASSSGMDNPSAKVGPTAVGASADDASEAATVVSLTANPLANCDTSGVWNGWIFRNLGIPAGATITSAIMTFQFTSATLDEPDVTLSGIDTGATISAFTTGASNISSRARTTASVNYANANAGANIDLDTPDLKTILQELVDSYGALTDVGLVWTTRAADGTRDTSVRSWDNSTTTCGRLTVYYLSAGQRLYDGGSAIVGADSSGAESFSGAASYQETGFAVAGMISDGGDQLAEVEIAAAVFGSVSDGADIGAGIDAGAAIFGLVASGADVEQASEAGAAITGWEASGTESMAANYVEAGAAVCGWVSAGAEQAAGVDSGAAICGWVSAGADVATEIDAGAAIAGWVASGAEVFSGVNNYVESGFAVCGWVAQAADQQAAAETGAAIVGWQASAAEVQAMAATGFAVVGWVASGAESTAASYTEAGSAAFGWVSTAADTAGLFDGGAAAIGLASAGTDVGGGVDLAAALFGLIASGRELASGIDAGSAVVGWVAAGDGVMLVPISAAPTLHPEPVHERWRSVGQVGAITRGRGRKVR